MIKTKIVEPARPVPKSAPTAASETKRGPGRPPSGKETVTIRLSSALLKKYRASGDGWQTRLNDDLMAVNGLKPKDQNK